MGGQVSRHNNNPLRGPVPITSLPGYSFYEHHAEDCIVPSFPSTLSHHHRPHCQCPCCIVPCAPHQSKQARRPTYNLPLVQESEPPLLFHPTTKGSQIIIDQSQRNVTRRGSFCNAIVFCNRSVSVNEVVRLKITHTHHAWQGALRIGFTSLDPARMNPKSLPKYSCPDLASQSNFWVKPLPEALLCSETVISFWVTRKGRVLYRINESIPKRLFRQVNSFLPLWALVDVYGKTKGVQLLDSETLPPDLSKISSLTRCQTVGSNRRQQLPLMELYEEGQDEDDDEHQYSDHMPQNSQNLRLCSELRESQDNELHIHAVHGEHLRMTDHHTVVTVDHEGEDKMLVFTSRPLECSESVFLMLHTVEQASLIYGVTACDPATLNSRDLPNDPTLLLGHGEFRAVGLEAVPLLDEDILGFEVNAEGELIMSINGVNHGVQLCVDNSRPLWMVFAPSKNITQLKIFGLSSHSDVQGLGRSPSFATTPTEPNVIHIRHLNSSQPSPGGPARTVENLVQLLNTPSSTQANVANVTSYNERQLRLSSSSHTETEKSALASSPSSPSALPATDDCAICCDDTADTALYNCGHLCLCYKCALRLKQDKATCPICRKPIKDIIKTYRGS
ncbi:E3 ubiquitin-protein ligase NEURL1-like isoform X2 [Corythoichthys intestinalis]|uniref:E3 ubiquitin-protein ligase NEURL1-like isoform X2 n=1 Tax=Corythoichthys intestinalis TaxID=161448 RepID=UPI0025A597B1|nr:E3 ubiquitin-protein ligase NEURL1-like isoform X2 [Corythoichthys intestinalis]